MKSVVKSTATHKGIALSKVRELKKLYGEMQGLFLAALEKAITMGAILTDIKDSLPYGEFGAWLDAAGLPFKRSTAYLYIRLHERREELDKAGIENVRDAQKFLSSGGNIDNEVVQRVGQVEEQKHSIEAASEPIPINLSSIKLTAREQQLIAKIVSMGGDRQSAENGIKMQKWEAKQERERRQKEKEQKAAQNAATPLKNIEVPPNIYRRFARVAKKTGRPLVDVLAEAADALTRTQKGR